jgi:hypothetical protein
MILVKRRPEQGMWFAWRPVSTPNGVVWWETVRFEWIDGSVFYYRTSPEMERAWAAAHGKPVKDACNYPRCTCMIEHGTTCPVNGAHS